MPTLYIAEAQKLGSGPRQEGVAQAIQLPPLAEDTVAIGSESAQSDAFGANTNLIRVHTDAACHVLVGANPTATTANMRLAADTTEYFAVTPGNKIAVIEAS